MPVLDDNYVWLVHDPAADETLAIDPGEAVPVIAAADACGWRIGQVWNTHWHRDHTGGNAALRAGGARVTAPAAEIAKIGDVDRGVADGDTVRLGAHVARVIATPGHTAGHVTFHFADEGLVFTGDTLFAMGCGRLFEGTPADMHGSLQRLAALPPETIAYGGHEYTLTNGRFALTAEPDNAAIAERLTDVERLRADGEATLPTTIGAEHATNPFMRAGSAEKLGALRAAKDDFRG